MSLAMLYFENSNFKCSWKRKIYQREDFKKNLIWTLDYDDIYVRELVT